MYERSLAFDLPPNILTGYQVGDGFTIIEPLPTRPEICYHAD